MRLSLKKTLVMFSVGLAALPVIVIGFLVLMMNLDIREIVYSEFDKIGARTTRQIVEDTVKICRIIQRTQLDEDEKAREAVRARIGALGAPRLLNEKIKLRVASQMTPTEMRSINLPVLSFGNVPIDLKKSLDDSMSDSVGQIREVLDSLKNDTGLDFSILQRIDEAGNMLRVASTVMDSEGAPYIGTYIPATGGYDDGGIVRTLLARKTFSGISRTLTTNFIVNYEPILDPYGDVIGAISYGRPQSSISYLLKYFEDIRIGSMGYVWAIELVGRGESVVKVSRDGKRNGFIVEGDTFKERREMALDMITSAVAQGEKIGLREYRLGSERSEGDVITAYTYFKPWNMVLGATVYRSDYSVGVEKIDSAARNFIFLLVPIGVGMLFFAGFTAWLAGVRGVQMIDGLESAIDKIKEGDIASAHDKLAALTDPKQWSNSEIFRLSVALNTMSSNLASLVSKVQVSGANLAKSASQISGGAAAIYSTTQARSETLSEVLGTINSISKSVVLLNADAREAAKNIDASLEFMSDGGNLLTRLNDNAASLLGAADSVSARLAVIKDKTERILSAISTINAVSERTNMLSLNASIEAERASEMCGGFNAVSSEISRLADRTAVSAMNVSKMVADMSGSVDLGVGDMESFSARMKSNSDMIRKLHENLASAEGQIAELGPKFESLASGVAGQEESAIAIGSLMQSLETLAEKTREQVDSLKEVTDSISKTSESLVEKVSRFRIPAKDS